MYKRLSRKLQSFSQSRGWQPGNKWSYRPLSGEKKRKKNKGGGLISEANRSYNEVHGTDYK